jgi:hypothetical protein
MPLGPMHPKVFQPSLKLVEFQPHGARPRNRYLPNMRQAESAIARQKRVVSLDLSWNKGDMEPTAIASTAAVVLP